MNTYFRKLAYAVLIALVMVTGVFSTGSASDANSTVASVNLNGGVIWYVTTTGDDSNDCATTTTPCATINGAIGKAVAGDTIYVATGTYTGDGTYVVSISKSVDLSGGWDETFTSNNGVSTIDGQNSRGGVDVYGNVIVYVERFIVMNGTQGILVDYNSSNTLTLNQVSVNNNLSDYGGGIYSSGNVTINNSTIDNNTAQLKGGGIYHFTGTLSLNNSTVSNNTVSSTWGEGGGIYSYDGDINLNNTTVIKNTSGYSGGGIYIGGILNISNSILADNTSSDCFIDTSYGGLFTSSGYNLIGNNSGCTFVPSDGDQVGTNSNPINPLLTPLQNNGGPTLTHALKAGSPALEAGNPAPPGGGGNVCITTDQRGITRPVGSRCDIGAFEADNITNPVAKAPRGSITDRTPTYKWSVVPLASHYQIQVKKGTKVVFSRIYTYACATPICLQTPAKTLAYYKKYKWRVRAMIDGVWGSWTTFNIFTIYPKSFYSNFNTKHPRWSPVSGVWAHENSMYYTSLGSSNQARSISYMDAYKKGVYTVRMLRHGCNTCAQFITIRGVPRPIDRNGFWKQAYNFQISNNGYFSIWKISSSMYSPLKGWTKTAAIHKSTTSTGKWNTLKVDFSGRAMKFYINGKLVAKKYDPLFVKGKMGIGFFSDTSPGNKLLLDWARFANGVPADLLWEVPIEGVTVPGGTIFQAPE